MRLTTEQRIKKAHIAMMRHPETALYSGVFMMGNTEVSEQAITAYTDGVNKKYGRAFVDALDDAQLNALILHENLHIVFRHLLHSRDLFMENRKLANMAADYVVNDVIASMKDRSLCTLPPGALLDAQYHNMNMREVYYKLRDECKKPQDPDGGNDKPDQKGDKQSSSGSGNDKEDYEFDTHDIEASMPKNVEDMKAQDTKIDRALREGALLAGRLGATVPRAIQDLLNPQTRWQEELREFVSAHTRGKDEFTWRKFNRRHLPNDLYLPSVENETIGEVVVAIDTSGSIGSKELTEFASELVAITEAVTPETVRVLWWDTQVHGEQIFQDDYTGIASMLKPLGGGGTRVSSVSEYIIRQKIRPECVIVFTDGYVEGNVKWEVKVPTLWLITQHKDWTPPVGRKVVFNQ